MEISCIFAQVETANYECWFRYSVDQEDFYFINLPTSLTEQQALVKAKNIDKRIFKVKLIK